MLTFCRTGHHRESAREALLITDINILLISKSSIMVDHSMVVSVVTVVNHNKNNHFSQEKELSVRAGNRLGVNCFELCSVSMTCAVVDGHPCSGVYMYLVMRWNFHGKDTECVTRKI